MLFGGGGRRGGLNAFYWRQLFTQDSVDTQNMSSSQGVFLTDAMHHHRETIYIKSKVKKTSS